MPIQPEIEEIAETVDRRKKEASFDPAKIGEMLEKGLEDKVIGAGAECIVTSIEGKPQEVAAYTYRMLSPAEAKRVFYTQRILSTLFPYNFPHFYAAIGAESSHKRATGTIRQKVVEESENKIAQSLTKLLYAHSPFQNKLLRKTLAIKHPWEKVIEESKKIELQLPVDYVGKNNFMLGADGGEYYVDRSSIDLSGVNQGKIHEYMKQNGYSEQDIEIIETSLNRLKALGISQQKQVD